MTITTRCFKILNSMLKYVCFTLISTFNLTPSATGTTGRDGLKTLGFYPLVRLVASCLSLLVLKYKDISHFMLRFVPFQQPFHSVVLVAICYIISSFFSAFWDLCYIRIHCRMVSVCRLLLGECTEPYRKLVHLDFVNFGLLTFYSKLVTIIQTGLAGRTSTYMFNPLRVIISCFTHRLLRLVQLVS